MLLEFRAVLLATCLAALWHPGVAESQMGEALRFDPRQNSLIHMVSRSEIEMMLMAGDGSDTVTVEATRLESFTAEIVAVAPGRYSVRLMYDSVRARLKPVGGTWRIVEPGPRDALVARVVLGSRMQVLAPAEYIDEPNVDVSNAEALRGLAGGFQLSLPDLSVSTGSSWTTHLRYPVTVLASVGGNQGAPTSGELLSDAMVSLDSVVRRGTDKLSYMTVRSRFEATRLESTAGSDSGYVEVGGGLIATLIWSSRWSAYVSGAVRVAVNLVFRAEPDPTAVTSRLRFDITTRFQVRT